MIHSGTWLCFCGCEEGSHDFGFIEEEVYKTVPVVAKHHNASGCVASGVSERLNDTILLINEISNVLQIGIQDFGGWLHAKLDYGFASYDLIENEHEPGNEVIFADTSAMHQEGSRHH